MRKFRKLFISILSLAAITLYLSSCKDDEPVPPAKLSFAKSSLTVKESDGIIQIEVILDKPVKNDIKIEYSLKGTAIDKVSAGSGSYDYEILSDYLKVEIDEGETSGIIEIELLSDLSFEDAETIEIEIESVNSDAVVITNDDDIDITIEQEDGLAIVLEWPTATVDMDLILRVGQTITSWDGFLAASFYGFPEVIFLPKVVEFPAYGLSYTYYDGNVDPLDFTVTFIDFADGVLEPPANRLSFTGQYTALNKNTFTDINTTVVVQTFQKVGGVFTNFSSPILIPSSGSRIGSTSLIPSISKTTQVKHGMLSDDSKIMLKQFDRKNR